MKKTIWILFFFFCKTFVYSQFNLSGIVVDENQEPLSFVNILINDSYQNGVATDINGKFNIISNKKIERLTLSYVGYEKLIYTLTETDDKSNLKLQLKAVANELSEAIVVAGENPAHRIIKKVVANRDKNNPEKIDAFQCQTYNKVIFDLLPNLEKLEKHKEKYEEKESKMKKNQIDYINRMIKLAEQRHIFMMESVTERKFLFPEKNNERVIYNRVSGIKEPTFAALANDVQPFSFYGDYFEVLGKSFLNPISKGCTKKYFYNIEDTLYQGIDTVFIISYTPRKGKNFEGLEGVLYINTDGYALQNVIARPAEQGFMTMKIEQRYVQVDGKQWFPEQLNFVFEATKYPNPSLGMRITGKSYISEVNLDVEFRKKDFKEAGISTDKNAHIRVDSIWKKHRFEELTTKEEVTYEVMDSLGKKKKFDAYLKGMEGLASGRYSIGKLDLDLRKMLGFNDFEGTRLGLGLVTNDKISKRFEVGGYTVYGFQDRQWKYGGHLLLDILPSEKLQLRFDYRNEIRQPALPIFSDQNALFSQSLYVNQMDSWEDYSGHLLGKVGRFTKFDLSFSNSKWQPNYFYRFGEDGILNNTFTFSEIGLNLRFIFAEKIVRFLGSEISESKYPLLFLSYKKGLKGILDGEFDFNQVIFSLEDNIRIRNLGETTIRLEAGWSEGRLPYSRLFTSSGIGRGFQWLEIENTFQTVDINEFLSDQFVNVFFTHNFGSLLLKTKRFAPEISVVHNLGFGKLQNPELHQEIDFKTLESGIFEAGLRIDNIVRLNYFNLMYLGLGGGVYYRYGKNSFPELEENLAYRFRITFSF